jgi:hypothetical protein
MVKIKLKAEIQLKNKYSSKIYSTVFITCNKTGEHGK